jgi:hypothetical protein
MTDLQDALLKPGNAVAFMSGFQLRGEKEGWPKATMNEIQNVIDTLLSQSEAARKVANPDLKAMAAVELNYIDFYGDQTVWRKGDSDNPLTVGDLFADEFRDEALRLIWAAALAIDSEDTDGI